MTKKIYLDYAGTTPMDPRVERVVLRHLKNDWGNASSVHEVGQQAKKVIEDSRKKVAEVLGCKTQEIIFTGSGTESDNLAIFGIARAYKKLGKHIITSKIEHPAILRSCQQLEAREGFKVTYLDVGESGIIDAGAVKRAIRSDTVLVSVMYANNEIGTVQSITEIAKAIGRFKNHKPIFHTDACQAGGALSLNVNGLGVDLMTLNGSKIYGPKATGCLFVRRGIDLVPLIVGGSQERGLRAGTESPALIAGFAKALELADAKRVKEGTRLIKLRDYLIAKILSGISGSYLNGDAARRLPNNINISFDDVHGEMLMLVLDQMGIQVSTGSACTSTLTEPSHVIRALGLPEAMTRGNIRITLGRRTTKKDADCVVSALFKAINRLR